MSQATSNLNPGDTLGAYQLLLPIGQGGMGQVWVAREKEAGPFPRYVAIKTALAQSSPNRQFWTALLDEAHIASSLRHPNVCSIHAVETQDSVVYLVMDWSDAGSLRELLDAAPGEKIAPQIAARIIAGVCAGLHAAHELTGEDGQLLGVVHRDVSPQNILFSTSGQVKLADFGVAKARGQLQEATRTGELKGKLSYMAPEQVTLKEFDRRADIFALGCVLYEATLGKRPFHGNDALATLYSLLEQPLTKPTEVDPSYPPGLEQIVLKSLAKDPADRFQTAEELGYALESWMASTRAVVTESNVATLLRELQGERIKERAQELAEMVRRLDAGESILPQGAESDHTPRTQLGMATQTTGTAPARARISLALVMLLVGAGGAAAFWASKGSSSASSASTGVAPSPVVTTAPPASVSLPVVAQPPVAVTPPAQDAEPSTESDGSRKPRTGGRVKPGSVGRPVTATKAGDPPAAPTPPTRAPGELPPVVEKAPRSLDADNPFAKKP